MKHLLVSALIAFALPATAFAQDATPATPPAATPSTLFPGVIDLPVIAGSRVPEDCQFPSTLQGERFDLACVVLARNYGTRNVGAAYVGALGERGWRQGSYIAGGMSATREDEAGCRRVLGIYPNTFPPNTETADEAVIWFALDRERHCAPGSVPPSTPQ